MAKNDITEATTKIVGLLKPFDSEERQRAVSAAMILMGEIATAVPKLPSGTESGDVADIAIAAGRAKTWMQQNGISSSDLEHVFQIDGADVQVIAADVPGKNGKEKTLSAYILQGLGRLLASNEPAFDDKDARALCKTLGCYNDANHAAYLKAKGNVMTGSKDAGWKLTAPGLKKGAEIVKELAKGE